MKAPAVPVAAEGTATDALSENLFDGVDASYQQIFARNPLPMWLYDVQSLRLLAVNAAALALYGYSRKAFLALSVPDLHAQEDRLRLRESLKLPLLVRVAQRVWRHRHSSGTVLDVEIATQDMALGKVQARMVMVQDLSEQLRAQRAEHEMAKRLRTTLENITDAVFGIDRDERFVYVNAQAEKVIQRKREDLLGRKVWEAYPGAEESTIYKEQKLALADGRARTYETADLDGLNKWLSVSLFPSEQGLTVYFRDITHAQDAHGRHQPDGRCPRQR